MKIKISWLWLCFFPFIIVSHFYKILFFLFILMSIHEGFHILCARCFGYRIESICIYPFGLSAQIQNFEYHKSIEEIIITLSGLSVHLIAIFFIPFLCHLLDVSTNFTTYLMRTNIAILCFNIIPIYPLDGGRILRNLLEFIFPFKMAKKLSLCTSLLLIPIVFSLFPFTKMQGSFFSFFFSMQLLFYIYHFKSDVATFYMYRFLHLVKGKIKFHNQSDLYKNRENYIVEEGLIMNEYEFLRKYIE